MSLIKSKNTKAEVLLGKHLYKFNVRYRKNSKLILGKPDFSVKKYKIAIFVDGEFWHGHNWNERKPKLKTNKDFWIKKIQKNMDRDKLVNDILRGKGWTVLRYWAKDVFRDPDKIALEIKQALDEKKSGFS